MIVALIALAVFVALLSVQVCYAQKKIKFLEFWLRNVDESSDVLNTINKLAGQDFEKRLKKLESEDK